MLVGDDAAVPSITLTSAREFKVAFGADEAPAVVQLNKFPAKLRSKVPTSVLQNKLTKVDVV